MEDRERRGGSSVFHLTWITWKVVERDLWNVVINNVDLVGNCNRNEKLLM